MPEIGARRADCQHVHAADEWQVEALPGGEVKLKSREEEYTAHHVFYVAVQLSVRAVRVGKAKLALPRIRILPVLVLVLVLAQVALRSGRSRTGATSTAEHRLPAHRCYEHRLL